MKTRSKFEIPPGLTVVLSVWSGSKQLSRRPLDPQPGFVHSVTEAEGFSVVLEFVPTPPKKKRKS